jgi:hypothetical protein
LTQHRFAFFDDAFGRPPKLILLFIQVLNAFRAVFAKHIASALAHQQRSDQRDTRAKANSE